MVLKKIFVIGVIFLLSGCISYYDEYEQNYYGPYGEYSYHNAPLRIKPLSHNDFYMLDNYPRDYINSQLWSGASDISRFAIYNLFRALVR